MRPGPRSGRLIGHDLSSSSGYARPVPGTPVHYRSSEEDSERWRGFPHRRGDIVISTRSKSGTTWVQMICALLAFQTPRLPAPLAELSPWLDWLVEPRDEVCARLRAQRHRRFIKTHTPLDGLPLDRRVTYVVVARQPLDHHERRIPLAGGEDLLAVGRPLLDERPEVAVQPQRLEPARELALGRGGRERRHLAGKIGIINCSV